MKLSTKGRYAVTAMMDLALHDNEGPVTLSDISSCQGISLSYLEQLFSMLRQTGLVQGVRGPGGGYVLARSMEEITIKDVLECVGENINPAKDILGTEAEQARTTEFHLSKNYIQNLGFIMSEYLSTTSLGDLIRKSGEVQSEVRGNAEVAQEQTQATAQTTTQSSSTESAFSEYASGIRSGLGEVNQ